VRRDGRLRLNDEPENETAFGRRPGDGGWRMKTAFFEPIGKKLGVVGAVARPPGGNDWQPRSPNLGHGEQLRVHVGEPPNAYRLVVHEFPSMSRPIASSSTPSAT
jgi:hypothetical protein